MSSMTRGAPNSRTTAAFMVVSFGLGPNPHQPGADTAVSGRVQSPQFRVSHAPGRARLRSGRPVRPGYSPWRSISTIRRVMASTASGSVPEALAQPTRR